MEGADAENAAPYPLLRIGKGTGYETHHRREGEAMSLEALIIAHMESQKGPTMEERWAQEAFDDHPLKPLAKPCHDCAVTCGMYREFSDDLAKQPRDIALGASLRWYCHNNPRRACAGNLANVRHILKEQTP